MCICHETRSETDNGDKGDQKEWKGMRKCQVGAWGEIYPVCIIYLYESLKK